MKSHCRSENRTIENANSEVPGFIIAVSMLAASLTLIGSCQNQQENRAAQRYTSLPATNVVAQAGGARVGITGRFAGQDEYTLDARYSPFTNYNSIVEGQKDH